MQLTMLVRDLLLVLIPLKTIQYTIAWEVTLPLVILTQGWAGISCYRAIAGLYPKIGKFAVWLFGVALAVSAAISLSGLPFELNGLKWAPITQSFYLCYRWTDTLLAGGLLLAVGFLSRFPSPLRRYPSNLLRHTALIASYFSLYAVTNLFQAWRNSTDLLRMSLVCLLYGIWIIALSKRGEETEAWPALDPEIGRWIEARNARIEALYHRAAGETLRLQIGRTE